MTILVLSDDKKTRFELLGKARKMADAAGTKVASLSFKACDCTPKGQGAIKNGADMVLLATPPIEEYNLEVYLAASAKAVEKVSPDLILVASTKDGHEFGPRLAAKLDKPCAVDCSDVRMEGGQLLVDRIMYGGNGIATLAFKTKPAVVTVPPKTFEAPAPDEGRKGEVIDLAFDLPVPKVKITKTTPKQTESVDLESAVVIVSCGRGIKKKEDIALIEGLAKALNAEIGCSRPIASDLKWLSVDHWVGLSGKKVKPSLYIAVGISGQIQHLAGMRDSKMIVAINKDKDAPIFTASDYGIVGDLYAIVNQLTEKLK